MKTSCTLLISPLSSFVLTYCQAHCFGQEIPLLRDGIIYCPLSALVPAFVLNHKRISEIPRSCSPYQHRVMIAPYWPAQIHDSWFSHSAWFSHFKFPPSEDRQVARMRDSWFSHSAWFLQFKLPSLSTLKTSAKNGHASVGICRFLSRMSWI